MPRVRRAVTIRPWTKRLKTINDRRCSYKWVGSELPGEGCFVGLTSVTPDLKRTDFLAR